MEYKTLDEFLDFVIATIEDHTNYDVGIVAPACDTPAIVKYLIQNSDYELASIDFVNTDVDGFAYNAEYIIEINFDGIWCEPAMRDEYINIANDVVFVMADCNSEVLKHIESDSVLEVDIIEDCDEGNDSSVGKIMSHWVSHDKSGKPDGFTLSIIEDDDDARAYSSFSYYNSDAEILREIAQKFGVKI